MPSDVLSEAQLDYLVKRLRAASKEEPTLPYYLAGIAADAIEQLRAIANTEKP